MRCDAINSLKTYKNLLFFKRMTNQIPHYFRKKKTNWNKIWDIEHLFIFNNL